MTVVVDSFDERAIAGARAIFEAVYGPLDPDLARWRYAGGPGATRFTWREGEVDAAQLVLQRRPMRVLGAPAEGGLMIDVMTHPDHRGRGLLRTLSTAALAHARAHGLAVGGYPNHRSERAFLDTGWGTLGPLPEWRATVTDGALARAGGWVASGPTADLNALASRLAPVHVDRSVEWLTWRLARPDQRYATYAPEDGTPGLLVLKRYGLDLLNVVELLAPPGPLVDGALALAHAHSAAEGRKKVSAWVAPDHPHASAYRAAGFAPVGSERVALIGGGDGTLAHRRWHTSPLDSDVF